MYDNVLGKSTLYELFQAPEGQQIRTEVLELDLWDGYYQRPDGTKECAVYFMGELNRCSPHYKRVPDK